MNKHHINRKRGAAIITAVIFFVVIATTMAVGLSSPVVREHVTSRDFEKSKGAYYLSEAGSEDALYRIKKGITISVQEILSLGGEHRNDDHYYSELRKNSDFCGRHTY